jgi:hypothetical protein
MKLEATSMAGFYDYLLSCSKQEPLYISTSLSLSLNGSEAFLPQEQELGS